MYIITDTGPDRQLLPHPVVVQFKFLMFEKIYRQLLVKVYNAHNFILEVDIIIIISIYHTSE